MGEILQFDNMLSKGLLIKLENLNFFRALNDLLSKKNLNKFEEIRKVEGSGFGCPISGFNDGIVYLLQKILVII
jgi:fused-like protein